jgi:uncharacterized membrane protein
MSPLALLPIVLAVWFVVGLVVALVVGRFFADPGGGAR